MVEVMVVAVVLVALVVVVVVEVLVADRKGLSMDGKFMLLLLTWVLVEEVSSLLLFSSTSSASDIPSVGEDVGEEGESRRTEALGV